MTGTTPFTGSLFHQSQLATSADFGIAARMATQVSPLRPRSLCDDWHHVRDRLRLQR
jgi:hypothetical protein